ncbi:putative quinol monooxygenase [Hymenobacter nivis]|uniref:Antibiotic biosynthesis monooxygenase n=1 Tax=Hymenobacter nivis TaxID=1850093 RepID=A0A502HBT3_9BACT|nr:putative quinol monooxygenase [Hymenobacter nivis]TPG72117.1 antibiotic biosynthesis monooxygenase [Hymenobacter nivis]
MPEDLYIVATLSAKPGQEDALRDLLVTATKTFRQEDGCLSYALHEDLKRPGRFITYEAWRDEAALAAHMKSPTMIAAGPQLEKMLDGEMTQDFLKTLLSL